MNILRSFALTAFMVVMALPVDAQTALQTSLPSMWFAGIDPVVAADRRRINIDHAAGNDFMELFRPDAPWDNAATQIGVFKLSTPFLQRSSDAQLATVITDLRRRHIALGMSADIVATSRACGNGLPGYTTQAVLQTAAERVVRLGGTIDFVAFDSAVAFGHFAHKRSTACHYSIGDLVENIAPNIRMFTTIFPNVVFGDAEPVNNHTVGWIDAYLAFAQQFQAVTGRRIAFFQAEVTWNERWRTQLVEWQARLRQAGISYGIVIDGSSIDRSDGEWTSHAVERYGRVMRTANIRPDHVLIESGYRFPTMFLPETRPGTLTSVVFATSRLRR